jgi:hypothetical protein
MKRNIGIFVIALLGAVSGAGIIKLFDSKPTYTTVSNSQPVQFANFPDHIIQNPNFVTASALATPAVVHIKTKVNPKKSQENNQEEEPEKQYNI